MLRFLLLGLMSAGILAAQHSLDLEGRYWIPRLSGDLRVDAGGLGTDIDPRKDLGIPNTNFPQGSVTWARGRSRLRFTYTPIDYGGDQTVSRTIVYRGTPYTVGTRVNSDLTVQHLQLSWAYQFVRVKDGVFRLGPMVEADGLLMSGRLTAPNLAQPLERTEKVSAGLPAAGLAMDIEPRHAIDIFGEAGGMKAGSYGYFVGSDAGMRLRLPAHLLLTAGYRTFSLGVSHAPDFVHLRLGGPFVGAGFSW